MWWQSQGGIRLCKRITKDDTGSYKYMNIKQGKLLAATERKQQLMSEASEEIHVLVLEDRISGRKVSSSRQVKK